jgi:hypothetical protein
MPISGGGFLFTSTPVVTLYKISSMHKNYKVHKEENVIHEQEGK